MSLPLFQIDVCDFDNERALAVADAVVQFLGRISLAQNNQFDSPVTTPPQFPNFVEGPRQGMEAAVDASGNPLALKGPVFVQILQARIYNLDS